jgi:hypothetical protein
MQVCAKKMCEVESELIKRICQKSRAAKEESMSLSCRNSQTFIASRLHTFSNRNAFTTELKPRWPHCFDAPHKFGSAQSGESGTGGTKKVSPSPSILILATSQSGFGARDDFCTIHVRVHRVLNEVVKIPPVNRSPLCACNQPWKDGVAARLKHTRRPTKIHSDVRKS